MVFLEAVVLELSIWKPTRRRGAMLHAMSNATSIPELEAGAPELPATVERIDGEYVLTARARIPRPLSEVFPFFSNARNLAKLTPDNMHFTILTEGEIDILEPSMPFHGPSLSDLLRVMYIRPHTARWCRPRRSTGPRLLFKVSPFVP